MAQELIMKRFIIITLVIFFVSISFAQESFERKLFNEFVTLFNNKDFDGAYKVIHPDLIDFVKNNDPTLYSFFGESGSIENVKFTRFDSTTVEITLTAIAGKDSLFRDFFIIKEGDHYYFTKPWYALTKNWDIVESEHFIFIFNGKNKHPKNGINFPTLLAIDIFEERIRWFLNILDIKKLEKKIQVYMVSTPEEVAKLVGAEGKFEGVTLPGADFCIAVFPYGVLHEVGHILLYKKTGKSMLPSILKHGIEEYGDGNGGLWKNFLSTYWVKQKIDTGDRLLLKDVKEYSGTTSFTKFLIEEWGNVKFRQLLKSVSDQKDSDLISLIEAVYQTKIEKIEEDWINWIKNYHETTEPLIRNRIEFRIIVNNFSRNNLGEYTTVYCDSERKLPLDFRVRNFEKAYSNQKSPFIKKSPQKIELYLLNDKNRMKELFGKEASVYIFKNIIAITTEIDHINWDNK
jgi:hypothetical protein